MRHRATPCEAVHVGMECGHGMRRWGDRERGWVRAHASGLERGSGLVRTRVGVDTRGSRLVRVTYRVSLCASRHLMVQYCAPHCVHV